MSPVTCPVSLPVNPDPPTPPTPATKPPIAVAIPDTLIFVPLKNATVDTPTELSDPKNPKLPTGATNPLEVVTIPVACIVSLKN